MPDFVRPEVFPKFFPHASKEIIDDLQRNYNKWMTEQGCPSKDNAVMYLANVAEESCGLTVLEENLNYSAKRLCAVWPKRFPNMRAASGYDHDPRALANFVYADRMGNGSAYTGDGYKFRGRGGIMWTGKDNYTWLASDLRTKEVLLTPDLVADPAFVGPGLISFYRRANLKSKMDLKAMTRAINGGLTNINERNAYYRKFKGYAPLLDAEVDAEPQAAYDGRIAGYMADLLKLAA